MTVPLVDLRRRICVLEADVLIAWKALLKEGPLIGGPAVEQFESAFARYCSVSHCISVANGTDALELGLRALDVQADDEVITVGNAGGYSTGACHAIGATPVYIDVVPSTCQLSAELVEEAVTSKTRAIIVTHLYGLMNDVVGIRDRLLTLQRPDIAILEDCAQAHGGALLWRALLVTLRHSASIQPRTLVRSVTLERYCLVTRVLQKEPDNFDNMVGRRNITR
jgi:dTDP-4-amino-4,6-dideoxygalactose transaminase